MARRQTRHKPILDQLRAAIREAERRGVTQYRLAAEAGIDRAQILRLMNGEVDPRLATAEKMAAAAGYRLPLIPMETANRMVSFLPEPEDFPVSAPPPQFTTR